MATNQMFKCADCGGVLEVVVACSCGPDTCIPACCGKPMQPLVENTVDAAKEKHVPVIEKIDGGYKVKIGAVPHPMTPEHWITTIELIAGNQVLRQTLSPTDQPEAVFKTDAAQVKAREYCNLHGLWTANA
ncbi:MAG: desulfoferrodoxin [Planctomycetes bacterium]|nr:desulfoferrodoxin [Planctomycetota bacterium]